MSGESLTVARVGFRQAANPASDLAAGHLQGPTRTRTRNSGPPPFSGEPRLAQGGDAQHARSADIRPAGDVGARALGPGRRRAVGVVEVDLVGFAGHGVLER